MPNGDPAAARILKLLHSGAEVSAGDIETFIDLVAAGQASDTQFGAFCAMVAERGLSTGQAVALAAALARTGQMIDWDDMALSGPVFGVIHNGGLGDISPLVIGPMLAACGGFCPVVSSRSTTTFMSAADRMSAIDGFNLTPALDDFKRIVRDIGWSVCSYDDKQTGTLLRFNKVRAETGTTEVPLLMAISYLSRHAMIKVDALAAYMQCGVGSMLRSVEDGEAFGALMRVIGGRLGMPNVTLIADARQARVVSFGAVPEIRRAIAYLGGESRKEAQHRVLMEIAGELLVMGRLSRSAQEAHSMLAHVLDSGLAAEVFNRMVAANGGPADLMARADSVLPAAPVQKPVVAARAGVVKAVDVAQLTRIHRGLGGARQHYDDSVQPAVGVTDCKLAGTVVSAGEPLAIIHALSESTAEEAAQIMREAFQFDDCMNGGDSMIYSRIKN